MRAILHVCQVCGKLARLRQRWERIKLFVCPIGGAIASRSIILLSTYEQEYMRKHSTSSIETHPFLEVWFEVLCVSSRKDRQTAVNRGRKYFGSHIE